MTEYEEGVTPPDSSLPDGTPVEDAPCEGDIMTGEYSDEFYAYTDGEWHKLTGSSLDDATVTGTGMVDHEGGTVDHEGAGIDASTLTPAEFGETYIRPGSVEISVDSSLSDDVIRSFVSESHEEEYVEASATTADVIRNIASMDVSDAPSHFVADMKGRVDRSRRGAISKGRDRPSYEPATWDSFVVETSRKMSKVILDRIADEVEKRENQGYHVDEVVLGMPQYEALTAWAQQNYGQDPEAVLPVDRIITVPGPQIHPVIDNKRMLTEYKTDK